MNIFSSRFPYPPQRPPPFLSRALFAPYAILSSLTPTSLAHYHYYNNSVVVCYISL
jgi:hypothetical protein